MNEDMFVNMLREFGEVRLWPRACPEGSRGRREAMPNLPLHVVLCCVNELACSPPLQVRNKPAFGIHQHRVWRAFADLAAAGVGKVQIAEFNETTSFRQQLEAVASTGVFVSVHTSNLANAQFLRPGSAVLEVIQRNWAHHDLDKSFHVRMSCLSASLSCPYPCGLLISRRLLCPSRLTRLRRKPYMHIECQKELRHHMPRLNANFLTGDMNVPGACIARKVARLRIAAGAGKRMALVASALITGAFVPPHAGPNGAHGRHPPLRLAVPAP